jgi:hypothetical protein
MGVQNPQERGVVNGPWSKAQRKLGVAQKHGSEVRIDGQKCKVAALLDTGVSVMRPNGEVKWIPREKFDIQ